MVEDKLFPSSDPPIEELAAILDFLEVALSQPILGCSASILKLKINTESRSFLSSKWNS